MRPGEERCKDHPWEFQPDTGVCHACIRGAQVNARAEREAAANAKRADMVGRTYRMAPGNFSDLHRAAGK